MSVDYALICEDCKAFVHLGVLRARGFYVEQLPTEIFLKNHLKCHSNIKIDTMDIVPDEYKNEDYVCDKCREVLECRMCPVCGTEFDFE